MVDKENSLLYYIYHISEDIYEDANRKIAITARNYMKPGNFNMYRFKKLKLRTSNSDRMHISNTTYNRVIIIINQSNLRMVRMYINEYNNAIFKYISFYCNNLIDTYNNYKLPADGVFLNRYPKLYNEIHIRITYSPFII